MTALRLADGTQYEARTIAPAATGDLAEGEHTFTAGGVSQQFTVSGGRWNAPKSDRRAEVDPNPTGLKLKFRAKDGTVSGSFTVADDGGKVKYTVVGAVVGGRLYGTAYSKKAPSLPATAE